MKAVIQTGGKQVTVTEGDVIHVELLGVEPATTYEFTDVRMIIADGAHHIGKPTVQGARVTAEVQAEVKGPKTRAVMFRKRKDSMTTKGHRQRYHRVKITGIHLG